MKVKVIFSIHLQQIKAIKLSLCKEKKIHIQFNKSIDFENATCKLPC